MGGHRDLRVFQQSYKLAMAIFELTRHFPTEERYSLTDQIRRSSRSVTANIAEGDRKRQYPNAFANKMSDADAEGTETQVWLEFARNCGYLSTAVCSRLIEEYEEVGRMLGSMILSPNKFAPR